MSSMTINNDDVIQDTAPKKRMSTKYPNCVALDWEEAEAIVREAEGGGNKPRAAYVVGHGKKLPRKGKSPIDIEWDSVTIVSDEDNALQTRVRSIGDYKPSRPKKWIHTIKPSRTHRAADWGVAIGASALFAIAVYVLFFLGVPVPR